jgi:GxxExxY protein
MVYELGTRGFPAKYEHPIYVPYKDTKLEGQRLDLLVADRIIVEIKCADQFAPIHEAQLISYLKSTGLRLGFLFNFKLQRLKDG